MSDENILCTHIHEKKKCIPAGQGRPHEPSRGGNLFLPTMDTTGELHLAFAMV